MTLTVASINGRAQQDERIFYDEGEFVPRWAKSAIWYQIFPERFRDGDPTNNPTVEDIRGADPEDPPKAWRIHPWGSDWYKLHDYEIENGEPELWKHLLRRRYGGDLQGIIDKLDYLQSLGVNAIYLNPLFDAPSLHKYDGASYHHIDPNFGSDPRHDRELVKQENPLDSSTWVWTKADELALELIEQVHQRGMRIIFDGVFNHMGINSFAFQDVLKNQQKSPYKDWFFIDSWDNPETGEKFRYEGWFGVESLPELREDKNGIVEGPSDYIFRATERWMNPKNKGTDFGIDGWRLDVAYCIGHPFWKKWRVHVRSINPQAYLTAEIIDPPHVVKPYLQGDEFDAVMNYNFAFTCAEFFFNPEPDRIYAVEFDKKLEELRNMYPPGVSHVMQNLFGSHDSNRLGSHIKNRGIGNFRNWSTYFDQSKADAGPKYDVSKPGPKEIQLQKLFAIMQMTYVGAPMIYYGDEVGMWGANDPDCRKPMIWEDIDYEDEVTNADGSKRSPDKVEIDHDLFAHYQKLIKIRADHKSLQLGSYKTLLADVNSDIFVFERTFQEETIIVALNNADSTTDIKLPCPSGGYEDVLNNSEHLSQSELLELSIPAKWGVVLLQI